MAHRSKSVNNTKGVTSRDVNAALRASQALHLRATQKLTYDEIAAQCGYSDRTSCYRAVKRELERVVVENVQELRREESRMLDYLQAELWPLVANKDNKARLFALDRLLAVSESRRKLMGLDMPTGDNTASNQIIVREVPVGLLPQTVVESKA